MTAFSKLICGIAIPSYMNIRQTCKFFLQVYLLSAFELLESRQVIAYERQQSEHVRWRVGAGLPRQAKEPANSRKLR